MSTENQTTVIGNSDYTPIDHRSADIGKAVEDRSGEQIKDDKTYQPVFPTEDHRAMFGEAGQHAEWEVSYKRYKELQETVAKYNDQRAYEALPTDAEKEFFVYERQIVKAKQEKEFNSAQKEWLRQVDPQLTRLAELRTEFTTADGWNGSDVAAVNKAVTQFATMGACQKTAAKMLAKIEARREAKLAQDDFDLDVQIAAHSNVIDELRAKRKKQREPDVDLEAKAVERSAAIKAKAAQNAAERERRKAKAEQLVSEGKYKAAWAVMAGESNE